MIGVDAFKGLGTDVLAQLALVFSAVTVGAAALFGRNFNGLDSMVPAAGSMICGAIILLPLSLLIDGIRTLGPVGTIAQAYLCVPIGVALGVVFLGETPAADGVDRSCLRRRRYRVDDGAGAQARHPSRILIGIPFAIARHLGVGRWNFYAM